MPGIVVSCAHCKGTGLVYDSKEESWDTCAACNGSGEIFIGSSLN